MKKRTRERTGEISEADGMSQGEPNDGAVNVFPI